MYKKNKVMRFVFLLCALTFSFSVHAKDYPTLKSAEAVSIGASKAYIASPEIGRLLLDQCSRSAPDPKNVTGYWTPSKTQLEQLEKQFLAYYQKRPESHAQYYPTEKTLHTYRRIYAGLVYNDRKIIYVDFARGNDFGADAIGPVCDGGSAFFGVEYDVETESFSHLSFNGII